MSTIGDVVRDVALLVFDRAVATARAKFPSAERLLVTREDIVQAVIELRSEQLALVCAQLDAAHREFAREAQAQADRIAAEWASGNHPDVEIVPPDGTEEWTKPYEKKE